MELAVGDAELGEVLSEAEGVGGSGFVAPSVGGGVEVEAAELAELLDVPDGIAPAELYT